MAKKSTKKSAKKSGVGEGSRRAAALDPFPSGVLLAAVIAGPPLWSLYQDGNIDLTTALLHGGLVAAGCGVGVAGINRLIADYRVQVDREQRIQQMLDALDDVVHEGLPLPPPADPTENRSPH